MKKFIIILLVILVNNLSYSQIQKGKWLIGTSINTNNNTFKFNSDNQFFTNTFTSNINLSPEINYLISDKFMICGGISYSIINSHFNNILPPQSSATSTSSDITNEGISGFLQAKYYVNISKNILWNISLKSGFGKINYTSKSSPTSFTLPVTTFSSIGQNANLEPTYFYSNLTSQVLFVPFKKLGFQLDIGGLNYLIYNYDKIANADISSNNVYFNINPSNWSLGIFYILGK